MTKWEYKVIDIVPDGRTLDKIHDIISRILNIHGKDGWELCGCSLQKYILKRLIKK